MEAINVQTPFAMPWNESGYWKRVARRMALKFRFRARIQEFDYLDPSTGKTTYLMVTDKFAVLSCGDEQWYFDKCRRA
jgi:hypothetical protein